MEHTLERYHYLQSTFLKAKDAPIQAESENYQRALVQIAGQLKEADAQFRRTAARLLEMLSDKIGAEAEEKRLIPTRTSGLEFAPAQSE